MILSHRTAVRIRVGMFRKPGGKASGFLLFLPMPQNELAMLVWVCYSARRWFPPFPATP